MKGGVIIEKQIFKRINNVLYNYGFWALIKKTLVFMTQVIYYNIWKLSPFKFCLSFYGVFIKKNYHDNSFKYYLIGQYGKFFSKFLKTQRGASIFLDIGANQGLYSLIALKNPFFTKIFSFEPQSKIYDILTENIQRNSRTERCVPMNFAISNSSKKGFMRIDEYDSGKSMIKTNENGELIDKAEFSANRRETLAEWNARYRWENIELIDGRKLSNFLSLEYGEKIGVKIDTETHEPFVLEALINTNFWQNVLWIFIEFSRKLDHQKCLDLLSKEGFSIAKKVGTDTHYNLLMKRL